jgi:nitrite reductase (NADH) small subunit
VSSGTLAGLVRAGPVSSFEAGVPHVIAVGTREIGVVRWGDSFYALRNHCPDQGGPLCQGAVRPLLSSGTVGVGVRLQLEEERPIIACPWHHYEFDLKTGHEIRGARRAVVYGVEVIDEQVYVRAGTRP